MVQRLQSTNTLVRVEGYEAVEEVDFQLIEGWGVFSHGDSSELGEGRFEVLELEGVRPVVFVGSSEHLEDFENLVNLAVTHEQGASLNHFSEDAPSRPQVYSKRVGLLTEQDLRAAVPKRDHFMSISLNWQSKSAGKSEVSQLNVLALGVD